MRFRYLLWFFILVACKGSAGKIPPVSAPPSPVTVTVVDAPSDPKADPKAEIGLWPSFVVDARGMLNLVYCDGFMGDVKRARRPNAKVPWKIDTVEKDNAVGKYLAADLGPSGLELVYLDQTRNTLRHAREQDDGGWAFADIAWDKDELGIAGRLAISPRGERSFLHYNTRNELLVSSGVGVAGDGKTVKWSTRTLIKAGGVHNIQLGALYDDKILHLSFPDWRVGSGVFHVATLPSGTQDLALEVVDERDVPGLKSAVVKTQGMFEYPYIASRGGRLWLAKAKAGGGFERELLTSNVANFAALAVSDGRLVLALQVGVKDGLGEGSVEVAVRGKDGAWTRWLVDDARPVGQYLTLAEAPKGTVNLAYYDGKQRALKYVQLP